MKVLPDRVAVRNDPPTATPGRRLACPLHSRRAQQPYASAKPAHGLGRCRSAENGPVDRCPTPRPHPRAPPPSLVSALAVSKRFDLAHRSRRANSSCRANRSGGGGRQGGGDKSPVAGRVYVRPRTPWHATACGAAPPPLETAHSSPLATAACTCGRPGIWLNDEVIEYYNRLLMTPLMTRENPAVRAYWLPTFFYPILVGRTQVERRKTHNFDQVKPFTRADFTRPRRHGQHL
jgi:hypothetical protein